MEAFLKKYGWLVYLVIIALISALLGVAVNQIVAINLAPYTVPELAELSAGSKANTKKSPRRRNKNLKQPIIQRCLFGCTDEPAANECPDGCPDGEVCQSGTCVALNGGPIDTELMVESDLKVKLMGCMVAKKPDYSLALLSDTGKQTFILGIGDMVLGEGEIVEIRRDRIIIKRNNRNEYIRLANSIGGSPTSKSSAAGRKFSAAERDEKRPSAVPKPPSISKAEAKAEAKRKEGVSEVAPNKFEIDKATLDKQLSDPKELAKQARILPNYKNGKPAGIKLVGVNPGSVYAKIGIKTGDVITSINGKKVTSQARAMELLDGLRGASGAQIQVERGGKSQSLSYTVK